ncbi:hypothetical protein CQ018_18930 [Arthrobacter sp. MYb227]|nr:hypothetical protein CQ018_18930 [Arthrobacter sp. MYb227]
MILALVFGTIYGLSAAIYLVIVLSAAKSKGFLGALVAGILVTAQGLLLFFNVSWAPRPTHIAESFGLSFNGDTKLTMFITIFVVTGGILAIAYFSGLIRWVSHWIDSIGTGRSENGEKA